MAFIPGFFGNLTINAMKKFNGSIFPSFCNHFIFPLTHHCCIERTLFDSIVMEQCYSAQACSGEVIIFIEPNFQSVQLVMQKYLYLKRCAVLTNTRSTKRLPTQLSQASHVGLTFNTTISFSITELHWKGNRLSQQYVNF